jgi:hypothetical protein
MQPEYKLNAQIMVMERITRSLIAPCGMDCGICVGHLRDKNRCQGCMAPDKGKPRAYAACRIKNCKRRTGKFCFTCKIFPCHLIRHLDKRYRTRYGMSEIGNLNAIKAKGISSFVKSERKKWQNSKGVLCVHNRKRYSD